MFIFINRHSSIQLNKIFFSKIFDFYQKKKKEIYEKTLDELGKSCKKFRQHFLSMLPIMFSKAIIINPYAAVKKKKELHPTNLQFYNM